MKVSITTTSFGKYDKGLLNLLEAEGLKVILNPHGRKLRKDEIYDLCKDSVGLIAGTETLDAEVLERLPALKVISRCGTGLDNVDLNAAKRLGIKVLNTADAPTLAVAELTVALMLNLLRKVDQMDILVKGGRWEKRMGNLMARQKVGIIGFGRIGRKVAELLRPFGCDIAYADPCVEDNSINVKRLPLEEVLRSSDIISIHVSVKERLIGEKEFSLMKKGAWLINTARGGIVEEASLYNFLKNGHLSGAAIDVFEEEPYTGPLRGLDNVILTPHIGSYAKEARIEMERQAIENLLSGLKGL